MACNRCGLCLTVKPGGWLVVARTEARAGIAPEHCPDGDRDRQHDCNGQQELVRAYCAFCAIERGSDAGHLLIPRLIHPARHRQFGERAGATETAYLNGNGQSTVVPVIDLCMIAMDLGHALFRPSGFSQHSSHARAYSDRQRSSDLRRSKGGRLHRVDGDKGAANILLSKRKEKYIIGAFV